MEKYYSLSEAEKITSIPRNTLRRWLRCGKLSGREVHKGQRLVWEVSQTTLDQLAQGQGKHSYEALVKEWEANQRSGYHTGKPIGERGIEANHYGLGKYWEYLGQEPTLENLSAENFRQAVSSVPIDHATKNCHFTQREQMYKGLCSFYKLLISKGIKSQGELLELQKRKPRRVYPAKKTVLTEEQVDILLKFNETWLTNRTEFDRELTRFLIVLITQTGLRRNEVIDLMLSDLDLKARSIRVANGKGNKPRVVGITPFLAKELERWITYYRPQTSVPNLLVQENGIALTRSVIFPRITRLAKAAGLE